MKKTITSIIILLVSAIQVYACRCTKGSIQDNLKSSDIVVVAKVVKVDERSSFPGHSEDSGKALGTKAEFEIIKIYKGDSTLTNITVDGGFYSCSIEFREGDTYLIYANKSNIVNVFYTNSCSRTGNILNNKDTEVLDKR